MELDYAGTCEIPYLVDVWGLFQQPSCHQSTFTRTIISFTASHRTKGPVIGLGPLVQTPRHLELSRLPHVCLVERGPTSAVRAHRPPPTCSYFLLILNHGEWDTFAGFFGCADEYSPISRSISLEIRPWQVYRGCASQRAHHGHESVTSVQLADNNDS